MHHSNSVNGHKESEKPPSIALPTATRELYPFQSHHFELAPGIRYHYVDEGDGDPVVMVHGNPTWSFYYRDLIRALSPTNRVIAMDHIGCGFSDRPDEKHYSYRLSRRVDDLDRLLDHLGVQNNITLVLHDWGGMIGMAWANRHVERVARLVILNTAAFPLPSGKKLPWQLWMIRNTPLGPILVRGLGLFSRGLVNQCAFKPLPEAVRVGYLAPYATWKDRLAVLRFVQDIPLKLGDPGFELIQSVDAGLHQFRKLPILLCWGRHDFVFDADFLAGWRKRFPAAETHVFDDAAHLVLEDAGDRIIPLVKDFLHRHPLDRS